MKNNLKLAKVFVQNLFRRNSTDLSSTRLFRKSGAGFTLIELLIVIAIIGILSAILILNLIGVRQRARDAQRKTDIRQIQSAIEIYRSDFGKYPIANGSTTFLYSTNCDSGVDAKLLNPNDANIVYMAKIPCNPMATGGIYSPSNGNYYYTSGNGTTYLLATCLENDQDQGPNVSFTTSTWCTLVSGNSSMKKYTVSQP